MAKIIILVIVIPFLSSVLFVGIATYLYYNVIPKLAINPQKEETKFNFKNIKLMFFCVIFFS
ncbi:hypothetical protein [Candidatus Phytoplasma tritici]|uniref:hypothetical protein n=1 Tax=Candidatus Phytoplasma tritici TaxID=321961 RepID=UPI00040D9368|nr:hypothetical protein [Candidatus Phytoplasma tritici]